MQLHKETVAILNSFKDINTNLVIKVGNTISTISPSSDILAEYSSDDSFSKQVSIYNLKEFLGVLSAFNEVDIELEDKLMKIKNGSQVVKYNYSDESLLVTPPSKIPKFPSVDIKFTLDAQTLETLIKMSAVLKASDLAIVGNGEKISLRIFDNKNSGCNEFNVETDFETDKTFEILFKIDKLKILAGSYDVEISVSGGAKISKFTNKDVKLFYYVALETDSTY